jgi:hypothetical protein
VSHKILLSKLNSIGITGKALKILESYLNNRIQITKIGQIKSNPHEIKFGIPQGSILGPLLFLIYVNDMHNIGLKAHLTLYADDTCLFYFGPKLETLIEQAQNDINLLHRWLLCNLLTINESKTKYIIFSAKNKIIKSHEPLVINGVTLQTTEQEKYLGLILDNKLTWKPHIDSLRSKITSLTGALRRIVRCLPKRVRYTIYNSLIKPNLEYLIEIWGSAAKSNLQTLQISQNKIIKVLFDYKRLTSTNTVYKETKTLNILQTYIYNTCLLVRKIINKDIHSHITFTKRSEVQKRLTRQANHIVLRPPRTLYGKKNLIYEGAQLYNKLPKDVKDAKSMMVFKKALRQHILNNQQALIK